METASHVTKKMGELNPKYIDIDFPPHDLHMEEDSDSEEEVWISKSPKRRDLSNMYVAGEEDFSPQELGPCTLSVWNYKNGKTEMATLKGKYKVADRNHSTNWGSWRKDHQRGFKGWKQVTGNSYCTRTAASHQKRRRKQPEADRFEDVEALIAGLPPAEVVEDGKDKTPYKMLGVTGATKEWITSWFQPTGNQREVQVNNLVSQVNNDVNEWNANSMRILAGRNNTGQSRIVTPWSLPVNGFQKLNFDAAFLKDSRYMGIGLIAFNDAGIRRGAQSIHGIANDEEQAEALAALAAIKWAKAEAVQNLHLEGDCLNVVNAINGSLGSVKWTNNNVIQDCRKLLEGFTNWICTFVHRESNEVANNLAKKARNLRTSETCNSVLPLWLKSLIRDKLNVNLD
ncbi:hypothetical protein C5167_018906 [Papaver somniferum]|uniref:RNase H type-1 domain-containing protein n=1 Tax=Papaver somniferum TaxID=3469 RepID=A0A4Y7ISS2_PAPSO|nr:hypothetical protein C5167_018906 [Papaver somniferum]